ncbi:unnamed protein product [Mytilus coruscus]|uniref:Uncharacterized protein n=1 Tax=Mytilus coruscus TaxID=42192 RepID=A0A6J8AAD1_MYTCO|nr:unnamed protein product [Mytilus coruscus]
MSYGICVLVLVAVAAVATSGYSTYGSHHHAHLRLYRKHIVHSGHYGHHGLAYYKRYHGFKITHGRFAYKGLGYKLTCGKTRFYRLWRSCYGRYHSRGYSHGGHGHYYKGQGHGHGHGHGYSHGHGHVYIHGHGHGHGHGYSHGHSHIYIHGHGHGHGHGYRHGHIHRAAYYSYYKKYHGFRIHHHRFSYGGKAYKLTCHRNRFYSLWNNCYSHYHSRSYCFGHLRKQHLFVSYHGGAYGHIHSVTIMDTHMIGCTAIIYFITRRLPITIIVGYGYGHGHVVSYLDYQNKYHGFPIAEHRFSYGGKAYQLKCESKRFYSLWRDCWSQYHSRSICFENLRKQHLFIDYPGDYADEYAPTKIIVKTGGDFAYKK